ncbi:transcriptional regulator [Klebsiella sp. RIT-PI-d]|uniref:type II toxin-antitoxin system HipA family toxin YjjJ n=1 Tax=Klebsiella sp. RIT-PI-d TaxID=1681196 RepID=UPI00067636E8|nr:type II toxin-antitoxin system HipA family toxin YjjJ [Klebsiella sp. RIT-PI-d]KNC06470.1 transcriptional regulator [Klebsiella sp. RIT-PI-d]
MTQITDLLLQGPRSATELRQHLSISQASFSRLIVKDERVIQFGKARSTRYALKRPIRGSNNIPLWRVDETGKAHKFATVYPCWPQGSCVVISCTGESQWFDGLPWFLTDLRPQGFLGRAWGRKLAACLGLPEDIRLWQEDEILYALTVFDGDYTGGWLVGENNYRRWIEEKTPQAIGESEKIARYVQLSHQALAGEIVGSSAGGEQPKFTCYAQTQQGDAHVIVKFTVLPQTIMTRRWSDLLVAESVALSLLREAGIAASESRAFFSPDGQTYLEAIRFDCTGANGRKSIVSLEALQSEYLSSPGAWPDVMRRLLKEGLVTHETLIECEKIWAFGRLIANSDMHAGNLSFYLSKSPFVMSPVYDMLPMAFAPNSAGIMRDEAFEPKFDIYVSKNAWLFALPLALTFWKMLVADKRISANFRTIASDMCGKIKLFSDKVTRAGA